MANSNLRVKYGTAALDAGLRMQPKSFEERLVQRNNLDQHFTRLWLDFAITGMYRRSGLDMRTRCLVLIGQFTMTKSHDALEDTIRAALAADVKAREILEIILHCVVYGGHTVVDPAIGLFHRIAEELNLLGELRASQLPLDGNDGERSYDEERRTWDPDDVAHPHFSDLMQRHGWLAVGRGLSLRPKHHLSSLDWQDKIDPEWANLWVKFCYQGMYSRGIVDDKTRMLCVVGDWIAVKAAKQARTHMYGALEAGATPREIIEVILQSAVNFGMPTANQALKIFVKIMEGQGRLAEIGNPPKQAEGDH